MKKKYISFLFAACLLGTMPSCSDWLDVTQNIEKDADKMFDNYSGFKGALTGCYSDLTKRDLYGTRMTMSTVDALASLWYLDMSVDYYDYIKENYYLRNHDYSQTMSQSIFESIYSNMYNAVLEVNRVIQAFQEGKGLVISDAKSRAVVEGEAYGLRAFLHLDILRLFGQVPVEASIQVKLPYAEVTSFEQSLTYYTFDEDYEEYVCDMDMDEDEYVRFLSDSHYVCPYYRNGDEYKIVRKQM